MIAFVGLLGIIFILIRSDYLLDYRHFNETTTSAVEEADREELAEAYSKPSILVLTSEDQSSISNSIVQTMKEIGQIPVSVPITNPLDLASNEYEGIIIATETIDKLNNLEKLISYVEDGGSVFFAVRPSPGAALSTLYQRLGMIEVGSFIETKGIELSDPIFKETFSQRFQSDKIINSSLAVRLSNTAKIYATSSDGLPLFWSSAHGEGQFIMFNGTILSDPTQQALLIQGIQRMKTHMIYPVINARVTALKGFPFPISGGKHMSGGMTNEEYFQQVIWADMQRLEAKYDLNYTASFVASYEDNPDTATSGGHTQADKGLLTLSHELLRMGGEIGVQGFNQQSLSQKSSKDVGSSMKEVAAQLEEAISNYPITSFIPVDEVQFLEHMDEVQEAFPHLRTVLANVSTPTVEGELATLPTTINHFETDDYSNWLIVNEMTKRGYFSHSLSLDRFVYTTDFEQVNKQFSLFQDKVQTDVPWLRSLPLSKAAEALPNYMQTEVFEEINKNEITFHLSRFSSPSYFYFYTEEGIVDTDNCQLTKIGPNLYLIEAEQLSFTIRLDG